MTNGQSEAPETPMEEAAQDTGGVSGMVNLTINLPDNIRISTVDSDGEETTVSNGNTTGMIQIYAGATAPEGWLLCNGAAVSRATYADLFAVIGTRYGVGNVNTTFNLPDLRGRFPLGKDDMGEVSADRVTDAEADVLGGSGGSATHSLSSPELASHSHAMLISSSTSAGSNPGESQESPAFRVFKKYNAPSGARYARYSYRQDHSNGYDDSNSHLFAFPSGDNAPHNNMPPWQTMNYLIKT